MVDAIIAYVPSKCEMYQLQTYIFHKYYIIMTCVVLYSHMLQCNITIYLSLIDMFLFKFLLCTGTAG